MKIRKILLTFGLIAALAVTGVTASAADTAEPGAETPETEKSEDIGRTPRSKHFNFDALTEEQKAEMEAKRDEMKAEMESRRTEMEAEKNKTNEKWNALTDAQKEELYGLMDKQHEIQGQLIDKYLEYGLIDEEEAGNMKDMLDSAGAKMRENNTIPFGMGVKMGRGFKTSADSPDSPSAPFEGKSFKRGFNNDSGTEA